MRASRSSSRPRSLAGAVALALAAVALSACTEVESAAVTGYEPAHLEPIEGRDDVQKVTFTQKGADRAGLQTAVIEERGSRLAVPYAAVIYDPFGKTFVYTVVEPLSFVREEVVIERVDGDVATVSDGPPAGTEVVTVGAAEVYGAELEIAGSH